MRLVMAAILALGVTALAVSPAAAASQPNCPSRGQVIDSLRADILMSDPWLVVSFSSVVGLSGAVLGVPAGIAAAVLGGGLAALSGVTTVAGLDSSVRNNLADIAARLGRNADDVYDQVRYGEEVITTSWLVRVAGAAVGSIVGLVVPLGIAPIDGMRASVVIGTAGGVVLGGLWHRLAVWPFHNDLPELCRAAGTSLRT